METEVIVVVGTLVDIIVGVTELDLELELERELELELDLELDLKLVCLNVVEDKGLSEVLVDGIFSEVVDIVD